MRIYNKYILSLIVASCLINTLLAFFGQNDLGVYININIIVYLAVTLFFVYLNPRARQALNTVGIALLAVFLVILILNVVDFLLGK